jgi:hypothetical protein
MRKKITIFKQTYTNENIDELEEDAFLSQYNQQTRNIPTDTDGYFLGTITMNITWNPPKD